MKNLSLFPPILLRILFAILASLRSLAIADDETIRSNADSTFPCSITSVVVEEESIRIEGRIPDMLKNCRLGWIPIEADANAIPNEDLLMPLEVKSDKFVATVPRTVKSNSADYDRLSARWVLAQKSDAGLKLVSTAHYADEIHCRSPQLPKVVAKSKKGLGGWSNHRLPNELDDLGIDSVTINIPIRPLVSTSPRPNHAPFEYQGRKYYANQAALEKYDETLRVAERRGAVVSAIILVTNPKNSSDSDTQLLAHPECEMEAHFAMPNVVSKEGIEYYGAILQLMSERWSKSNGSHGRIHHWIMHNEVDAGRVWTNAGDKTDVEYMDLYVRSMRLMHLIAKQHDSASRVFISLDHHWAEKGKPEWYASRRLLELLVKHGQSEGDFDWGVAYHPYPQSLFNPRTWEDKQATFNFDTKKITPRNIEVLDAYMKRPAMLFRGQTRPVHLSENGFNSKDYSDKSLTDQAAGMAYAWKKIQALSSIETWHYHNWIDNRHEGGLRIGLRKFQDDEEEPLGKKPIWHLYQALGTANEDVACEPYLKTIGLENWNILSPLAHSDGRGAGGEGLLPSASSSSTQMQTRMKTPNLLIILTEDQGAHMSALGTPGLQTPHMDALAQSGTLFRNAFVAYPVCSASKAALYSGLHNHTNGILNNTVNYHKPASQLTEGEKRHRLYQTNRIRDGIPTLVERLNQAGYYQGVTSKLHVVPNEKFPYDEFMKSHDKQAAADFIQRAKQVGKPWHLFFNIPNSHRPFPNSDKVEIRVDPSQVKLPRFLPDTPVVRQDWAEYLAAIEEADRFVGEVMEALRESGQADNTYVVFLGDHGPCFVHGKMTLYDLGLRVPLVVRGPNLPSNVVSQALISEVDIFPTIVDFLSLPSLAKTHGVSFREALEKKSLSSKRDFAFAEISHLGPLPNDGMQERSVTDGTWHLIYREKVEKRWRQVQADSKQWTPWGNRSYDETVRVKDQFPEAYRLLTQFDPQNLDGHVPKTELYFLPSDPDELQNRIGDGSIIDHEERLLEALKSWVKETNDPAVQPR